MLILFKLRLIIDHKARAKGLNFNYQKGHPGQARRYIGSSAQIEPFLTLLGASSLSSHLFRVW